MEQQGQLACEQVRFARAGPAGEIHHPRPDHTLVLHGSRMHVAAGFCLGGRIDKRAAMISIAATGGGKGVEHATHLLWILTSRPGSGPQLSEPGVVDLVQVGEYEIILAREVLVQSCLGNAGLGHNGVDPDPSGAAGVEQPERGVEDALTCGLAIR